MSTQLELEELRCGVAGTASHTPHRHDDEGNAPVNDLSSPRLQVVINGATAPARVLTVLKDETGLGFSELRALIAVSAPVLDVEMFTNDWYDSGAARILDLLSGWDAQGVGYILCETFPEPDGGEATGDASRITVVELRNIIRSGEEERARQEELDNLKYGVPRD